MAYDSLNSVIAFENAVTKAANMDLSYIRLRVAAVRKAIEEAENF